MFEAPADVWVFVVQNPPQHAREEHSPNDKPSITKLLRDVQAVERSAAMPNETGLRRLMDSAVSGTPVSDEAADGLRGSPRSIVAWFVDLRVE